MELLTSDSERTNDIGKVILILQVIIGPISAIFVAKKYLSLRRREPAWE